MARSPRFTAIPSIPQTGLSDWQFNTLTAMKENLELLIGARGNTNATRAVVTGQIGVQPAPNQSMTQVTATGAGYTISGVDVPSLADYIKLAQNVQSLANDVANVRGTLNALISQLKG
jgi:hypothetical protein